MNEGKYIILSQSLDFQFTYLCYYSTYNIVIAQTAPFMWLEIEILCK